ACCWTGRVASPAKAVGNARRTGAAGRGIRGANETIDLLRNPPNRPRRRGRIASADKRVARCKWRGARFGHRWDWKYHGDYDFAVPLLVKELENRNYGNDDVSYSLHGRNLGLGLNQRQL